MEWKKLLNKLFDNQQLDLIQSIITFFEENDLEYNRKDADKDSLDDCNYCIFFTSSNFMLIAEDDKLYLHMYAIAKPDFSAKIGFSLAKSFPDLIISDMIYVTETGKLIEGNAAFLRMLRTESMRSVNDFIFRCSLCSSIDTDEIIN